VMKFKVFPLLALLVLLIGLVADDQTAALAARPSQQEPPLRLSEPTEAIVTDLEDYIPDYMHEKNIPGVAIALIRDGEIVWTEGFGVANAITRKPVTPETPFEVASNSKVVTAYIALRLVDQGKLSLDEPLNAYLSEPWLPPSEYRDTITLRHVLSHSSGLGRIGGKSLFAPGRGYYYSASGLLYLQAVIEQVTGQSLEDAAQEMAFVPLGMSSSSYVNPTEITPRTANGHVRAFVPALLFTVPFVASLVIVGLLGLLILRIRTGQWRPTRWMVIGTCAVAFVLSLLLAFVLFREMSWLEFAWLIAFCGIILAIAFALAYFAGRVIILRLSPERPRKLTAPTIVLSMLIVVVLACSQARSNLPVSKWPATHADAAGSVRATVGDMAAFLIELSNPRYLSAETATQLQTSQVRLSSDLSWGLGPGIQHSHQGDALWQWGQHIDFQSVMIIYPEHGFGVVVCTNNDLLNPEVAVEIAHRALGGKIEPIRRAIRLEFNYREEKDDETQGR
jgi:CubicO group peptidase (beta-lactamase class C family)